MKNLISTQTKILLFGSIILLIVGGGVLVSYVYFPKKTENNNQINITSKINSTVQASSVASVINSTKEIPGINILPKPQSKNYVYTSSKPIFYFTQVIADGGLEVVNISKKDTQANLTKIDFALIDGSKAVIVDSKQSNQWINDYYVDPTKKLDLGIVPQDIVNDYFWLNFESLKKNLIKIKEFLIQKDINNKIVYEKNYDRIALKLDGMLQKYKKKLSNCSTKTIIENGNTFQDTSSQYSLEHVALNNKDLIKTTDEQLQEIKKTLLINKVKTIFVVGDYTDADLNVISTALENIEIIKLDNFVDNRFGSDYFEVIDKNLVALSDGLGCV
jgi:ABC-type Zn uptake system ZnuABC Zn-binding protein ZnuA